MRSVAIINILLALIASALPRTANAGPLRELESSKTMHKFKGKENRFDATSEEEFGHWLREGSNYGSIFLHETKPETVLSWIIPNLSGFELKKAERDIAGSGDVTSITGSYASPVEGKLQLILVVPHPKAFEMLEFNLVKKYAIHKEPSHISASSIKIKEQDATVFTDRYGKLSLVVELEKHCLAVIKSRDIMELDVLKAFAERLEYTRFHQKLNT